MAGEWVTIHLKVEKSLNAGNVTDSPAFCRGFSLIVYLRKSGLRAIHMTIMGYIKKVMSEALPFVARNPAMQVDWLVMQFRRGVLTDEEMAPYIHLLLSGHASRREMDSDDDLLEIFSRLDREIKVSMIRCAEIYDVPELLSLIGELSVDDAIIVLKKVPPPYEKKGLLVLDRVFQAVNECGDHLLERAARKMAADGNPPDHFASAYERFQEILIDEKILAQLYPQAVEGQKKGR